MSKNYWLFKSEPDAFSIHDLSKLPNQTTFWDGVRNYQARNFMRDQMKTNELAFFYHSNCSVPGIYGIVKISREAHPDVTAYDKKSPYYDPKSSPENPRWFAVDVQFVRAFERPITLAQIKAHQNLQHLSLVQKGNRLSVMPIPEDAWNTLLKLPQAQHASL